MTLWSHVAACWKAPDGTRFDKGVLESLFPADVSAKDRRHAIFQAMDGNGNQYVSLAEFDDWFNRATCAYEKKVAHLKPVDGKSTLFPYARPSLIRAFTLAKGVAPPVEAARRHPDFDDDDYVTQSEVALLMLALQHCLKIFRLFDEVDASHDRRLERREWDARLFTINAELVEMGYTGKKITSSDFNKIDVDAGGMILLSEAVYFFLKVLCPNETLLKRNEVIGANPTGIIEQGGRTDAGISAPCKKNAHSKSCTIL